LATNTSFSGTGSGANIPFKGITGTGQTNYEGYASAITADATNGTPRVGSETRPSNIAMLYCIKY
jgi:hypothetical protein